MGPLGYIPKRLIFDPSDEQMKQAQTAKTPAESVGHTVAAALPLGPWVAQTAEQVGSKVGQRDYAGAAGTVAGNATLAVAPKAVGKGVEAVRNVGEALKSKYGPRTVEVGGEKVPVLVGEASPESSAGRTQVNLKRTGAGSSKFEKVEGKQQEGIKNVIKNTAQKASGQMGPLQPEAGAVVNDAATASFAQATPLYESLDKSLQSVPETLQGVSRIVQDAMAKAKKLGANIDDGGMDISKIHPAKDGSIQFGGTRISRSSHPEIWQKLVSDGIIDESGNGTPVKAYREVISRLKAMQRSSTDGSARYAIGNEIENMTASMDKALQGSGLDKTWHEADRLWSQGKARIEVADAITDATKGTPAHLQAKGISQVPTKLQGASLVDKFNKLADDGVLQKAFTEPEIKNLREAADILDRIQRTPTGRGSGESMSMSRGLTHAVRGSKGPLIGAGVGAVIGGIPGAEAGAGLGFILQSIGERALINVMTNTEGVSALKALSEAKTPEAVKAATLAVIAASNAQPKKQVADFLR
jgi:hypothetical protein